jgi:transcriptional regulator with XRE-family HTH domain
MVEPIGGRIARLRKEHHWSLRQLAGRSGLSHVHIADLEKGRSANPTQDTLAKLAAAFGMSSEELLAGTRDAEGDEGPVAVALREVAAAYSTKDDVIDRLLKYITTLQVFDPVDVIGMWSALPRSQQDSIADYIRWQSERADQAGATREAR